MAISLYEASIPVFARMLGHLAGILEKAAAHAGSRGIDPADLLESRPHPDMYPLAEQARIAADAAADCAARLALVDAPAWKNDERSFAELVARVRATIDFLEALEPAQFDGAEDRLVSWTARGATISAKGTPYLLHHAMPKFYFHLTTAYAILRHRGVELRKGDFLGKL